MNLHLARHGQSTANVQRWISGWTDVPLTDEGRRQARELAERVANLPPLAGVLCSDLARARITAEVVAKENRLALITDKRLRERNYGLLTGTPYGGGEGWTEDRVRLVRASEGYAPDGGETLLQLRRRIVTAIDEAVARWEGRPFLVISHRGVMRAVLQIVLGLGFDEVPETPDPPETMSVQWPGKRAISILS